MDRVAREVRSRIMRSVGSRNTKPEVTVRHALHSAGLRYRLHVRTLPGTPDIVLRSRRVAVFIHGCFWHDCPRCRRRKRSKSNLTYWMPKLAQNRERDRRTARALRAMGWRVLTLWECQVKSAHRLRSFVQSIVKMPEARPRRP